LVLITITASRGISARLTNLNLTRTWRYLIHLLTYLVSLYRLQCGGEMCLLQVGRATQVRLAVTAGLEIQATPALMEAPVSPDQEDLPDSPGDLPLR